MALKKSIISRVQRESEQWHDTRAPLLAKIGAHFKKNVVVFQTSFMFDNGLIEDADATMLEEVLLSSKIRNNLLLIVNSAGGFGLAAERIIRVCRKYSVNGFEALVPHMAKSAATIICFGSKRIWMGETSELGPVDPQLRIGKRYVSVYNILKSYDALLVKASKAKGNIDPYLHQLSVYDPRDMAQLRQEMDLSEAMSVQLLKSGMMRGKSEARIRKCIQMFIDPQKTLEHGRPLFWEDSKKCGIAVDKIGVDKPIWEVIWELQLRYDGIMGRFGKVVESVDDSFSLPGHFHHKDD